MRDAIVACKCMKITDPLLLLQRSTVTLVIGARFVILAFSICS